MQSLLRWGIENSTPQNTTNTNTNNTNNNTNTPNTPNTTTTNNNNNNAPPARRPDLHPEIIDLLLGKSDAQLMKEAMAIAVDEGNTEEDRVSALDNLEMLIEQIDNANDLENLKMWDPLHALLTSSTDGITTQTLWVIGTALQNNPSAQDAYLKLNPLPTLTSFLSPSPSPSKPLRSKAIYALSGLLKHNAPALLQLGITDADGCDGWDKIRIALQDPDITIRRKTLFLLNALLISSPDPSPSHSPENLHTPSQNLHTPSQHSQNAQNPIHPNSHSMHLSDPSRAATAPPTYEALRTHGIIDTLIAGLTRSLPYGGDGDTRGEVDTKENGDTKEEVDGEFEEMGVGLLNTYLTHSLTHTQSPSQPQTQPQHPTPPLTASQKTRLRDWISSLTKDSFSNESDETSENGLGHGTSENGLGNETSGNGGDEETSGNGGNKKLAERWGMSVGEVEDFVRMVG
ncbi:nucleotide exchange factor Fes1-domain-containing protein [Lentinula edodes]|uniref:Nucleotide exchange factor Fes1-domain-containing protein n=1 Tax=Lentinula lateritia TaxID=40482 RepID=A0A9W9B585_9AGAR|nr:nucleotide exchange factor Fes1-domain-containing protein [Lentinula edodes]